MLANSDWQVAQQTNKANEMTGSETIHSACYNQNTKLVKQLLINIKPTVLNKKITDYSSLIQGAPLHIACKNGNIKIVRLLIEAGADKEIKDVGRQSPLSIAASKNYYDITKYLIEVGADVHSKGPNGLQPIHFACAGGDRKIIELLLSQGIDVNIVDSLKSSLLEFTTNLGIGNLEAAKTLVENGIDDKHISTGFKWACWRNNPRIAKYLLKCGADYQSHTTPKSELLFWICELGHKEIVKLLLKLNVDFTKKVNFKGRMSSYNGSPLDRAIATNQIEIVKLIRGA
ncbi:ankyrin repeat domain-containing protein [Hymenobacter negativus]|uniref:Ankyrin repeat domain-containing protein n=1 Tax=Hymenobacter negativus TaxID=2795026 RepID=A0ABS3QC85_9BACT|nr:ankyrin repeat domain-containing protein [Hymenobacter negativus]MBO2008850.1 ankyrin repeat domain-containing protein [Hymenobacter negativus]